MMTLYFALIFAAGLSLGLMISSMSTVRRLGAGSIVVTKDEESGKILYTLTINGDPEKLQYEKYVLFDVKVVPFEEVLRD